MAERAKQAYQQIKELKVTIDRLDAEIEANNIPHVIVEGPTDKKILEEAFSRLYPGGDRICEFVHAGGATNIPPYIKSAKVLSKEVPYPIVGLFDRDSEGRKQMKELKVDIRIGDTDFFVVSRDRNLYAGSLPLPSDLKEIEENLKDKEGDHLNIPIPIEYMFHHETVNQAIVENVIGLEDRIVKANDPELPTNINLSEIYSSNLPEEYLYLSKKVKKDTKTNFADWVIGRGDECFECFRPLFGQLEEVLVVALE